MLTGIRGGREEGRAAGALLTVTGGDVKDALPTVMTARTSTSHGPRPSGTLKPPADRYCPRSMCMTSSVPSSRQFTSATCTLGGHSHDNARPADRERHEAMHPGRQLGLEARFAPR